MDLEQPDPPGRPLRHVVQKRSSLVLVYRLLGVEEVLYGDAHNMAVRYSCSIVMVPGTKDQAISQLIPCRTLPLAFSCKTPHDIPPFFLLMLLLFQASPGFLVPTDSLVFPFLFCLPPLLPVCAFLVTHGV